MSMSQVMVGYGCYDFGLFFRVKNIGDIVLQTLKKNFYKATVSYNWRIDVMRNYIEKQTLLYLTTFIFHNSPRLYVVIHLGYN